MKAIILAAGYATRLYPLTIDKPKPLLSVAGKPMMEHIIDKLKDIMELDRIYIVTNDKFSSHFSKWASGIDFPKDIVIVNDKTTNNDDRLGAVGDIRFVLGEQKVDDDVLIFGGDNLFEDRFDGLLKLFFEKKAPVVGFKDVGDLEIAKRMGVGDLDEQRRVVGFVEKPPEPKSTLVSTLIYLIPKTGLHYVADCIKDTKSEGEIKAGELIAYMIRKTDVFGHIFYGKWFDIGDLEQLKVADEEFMPGGQ